MSSGVKVFINYDKKDVETAKKLYGDLKDACVAPWMDTENILPGHTPEIEIVKAIKESSYFLILLSSNSVIRKDRTEINEAIKIYKKLKPGTIYIIPVRIEDCEADDEDLLDLQCADIFPPDSYADGLNKILTVILSDKKNELSLSNIDNTNITNDKQTQFSNTPESLSDKKNESSLPNIDNINTTELKSRIIFLLISWSLIIGTIILFFFFAWLFRGALQQLQPRDSQPAQYSETKKSGTVETTKDNDKTQGNTINQIFDIKKDSSIVTLRIMVLINYHPHRKDYKLYINKPLKLFYIEFMEKWEKPKKISYESWSDIIRHIEINNESSDKTQIIFYLRENIQNPDIEATSQGLIITIRSLETYWQ